MTQIVWEIEYLTVRHAKTPQAISSNWFRHA